MTPADRFQPISDSDLGWLASEGCNAAELSAYTGMTELAIAEKLAHPESPTWLTATANAYISPLSAWPSIRARY